MYPSVLVFIRLFSAGLLLEDKKMDQKEEEMKKKKMK
jgi:hypothetical protein